MRVSASDGAAYERFRRIGRYPVRPSHVRQFIETLWLVAIGERAAARPAALIFFDCVSSGGGPDPSPQPMHKASLYW